MELYIQVVIGYAISSFTILIFAGISPLEHLLQSISLIRIDFNKFRFKIEEILAFIFNYLDTRMVTETRHSCENIRTVLGIINLVEYFQIFRNVIKTIIEGF